MQQARATLRRIGLQLIEERRSEVIDEMRGKSGAGGDGEKSMLERDLLSVLGTSLPPPSPNTHPVFIRSSTNHSQIKLLPFPIAPNVNRGDLMSDLHTDGGGTRNDVDGTDVDFICACKVSC
jgi:hypothetical protein